MDHRRSVTCVQSRAFVRSRNSPVGSVFFSHSRFGVTRTRLAQDGDCPNGLRDRLDGLQRHHTVGMVRCVQYQDKGVFFFLFFLSDLSSKVIQPLCQQRLGRAMSSSVALPCTRPLSQRCLLECVTKGCALGAFCGGGVAIHSRRRRWSGAGRIHPGPEDDSVAELSLCLRRERFQRASRAGAATEK